MCTIKSAVNKEGVDSQSTKKMALHVFSLAGFLISCFPEFCFFVVQMVHTTGTQFIHVTLQKWCYIFYIVTMFASQALLAYALNTIVREVIKNNKVERNNHDYDIRSESSSSSSEYQPQNTSLLTMGPNSYRGSGPYSTQNESRITSRGLSSHSLSTRQISNRSSHNITVFH